MTDVTPRQRQVLETLSRLRERVFLSELGASTSVLDALERRGFVNSVSRVKAITSTSRGGVVTYAAAYRITLEGRTYLKENETVRPADKPEVGSVWTRDGVTRRVDGVADVGQGYEVVYRKRLKDGSFGGQARQCWSATWQTWARGARREEAGSDQA